jgi:hypothetical protein
MSLGDAVVKLLATILLAAIMAQIFVVFGEPRRQAHARLVPSPHVQRLITASIHRPAVDRDIKVSAIRP